MKLLMLKLEIFVSSKNSSLNIGVLIFKQLLKISAFWTINFFNGCSYLSLVVVINMLRQTPTGSRFILRNIKWVAASFKHNDKQLWNRLSFKAIADDFLCIFFNQIVIFFHGLAFRKIYKLLRKRNAVPTLGYKQSALEARVAVCQIISFLLLNSIDLSK